MPITTTVTATCDYSLCGIELDPDAIPIRATCELRLPNGAIHEVRLCACTAGHAALAAGEWADKAQAFLDSVPEEEVNA
jgi:hypothetical protein